MLKVLFKGLHRLCMRLAGPPRGGTLVVQPLPGIGDMVWHLPHLHAIAAATPEKRITVLTKPRSRADKLLGADAAVASVLWLQRPGEHGGPLGFFRLVALLRQHRFATAWLLHGSRRYALALLLAGVPETIGYGRGAQKYLLSNPVQTRHCFRKAHPITLADELLNSRGLVIDRRTPQLHLDTINQSKTLEHYRSQPRPWMILGIGCSESNRQWGTANFTQLAAELLERTQGTVFLSGGTAEEEIARIIKTACPAGGQVIQATQLPLDESAALLAASDVCIANETGVFNIASALGIPTIGLIVTDWQPPPLENVTCLRPVPPHSGPSGISVEQVCAAASKYLGMDKKQIQYD